jgi:hypothetical protein
MIGNDATKGNRASVLCAYADEIRRRGEPRYNDRGIGLHCGNFPILLFYGLLTFGFVLN